MVARMSPRVSDYSMSRKRMLGWVGIDQPMKMRQTSRGTDKKLYDNNKLSAAEMTKLASIKLQPLLKELDSMILLWVHDELIIDAPKNIGMDNIRRITEVMCNALPLCVPMKSDAEVGDRWSEKLDEDTIERLRYLRQDEEDTEDTDEEEEDIDTTEDD